ncbi:MAG: RHS repeat-associated core domain-containing protein [Lewinellaceae bacterium]|nr:RHS repeat-associated core domain-containing protein [Lewinellaceae bacterium]
MSEPLYETPNTTAAAHYYTGVTFPTDNNIDYYKIFYYDDYDLDNNGSLAANETYTNPGDSGYETAAFTRTRGKATAAKTAILPNDDSTPTIFLITRTYYDKEYSVIQINKQNHLGGADIISSVYDFANRLTKTRREHTATPPGGTLKTYVIREEYTLDHAGRVRFTRHHIATTTTPNPTSGWVVTSAPVYDESGRLVDKRLHASNYDGSSAITTSSNFNYLQSLDYTYNIRSWLTGLNDMANCNVQAGDQLADLLKMQLSYDVPTGGGTAQFNGNISTMQWRTYINSTCSPQHQYRFTYDPLNRLTAADHYTNSSGSWTFTNNYSESGITYDLNGNLKTYTRRGLTVAPTTYGIIDQLTYTYSDGARPDKLSQIGDAGSATKGFKFTTGAASYGYDSNGNMTLDNHKSLTINYNFLNLPRTFTSGANTMTVTYTADGEKLGKTVSGVTKNYVSGIEYSGANLEAIYHADGRCTLNTATTFYYEYTLKDHLGNARVSWRAITNGTAIQVLQENHYYPFGMAQEGSWTPQVGTENQYQYNSKEFNEDLGVNWYNYGARCYDPAVGRWWSVDPLAEKYRSWSPYQYGLNNSVRMIDPDGRQVQDIIIRYSKDMTEDDRAKYNKQISTILGNLTDDKISIKNGKVTIDEKSDGSKKNATRLIRGFIEGMNVGDKIVKRDVTITKNAEGQKNATTVVDTKSNDPDERPANASNGIGVSNSIIAFDPESPSGKGYYPADGGEKATASNEMALLHELVHAHRNAAGVRASVARGSCGCKRGEHVTLEEAKVQTIMNTVFQPENSKFIQLTENPYKD